MNKKELMTEAAKKRFQQILEFTNYGGNRIDDSSYLIDEEGDDENQDDPAMDDMGNGAPAGGDAMQPQGGGMPDSPDAGMDMGGGMPQGGDMSQGMGGNTTQQGENNTTPEGFNPQDMGGGMPQDMSGDLSQSDFEGGVQPDDDVVDVSDLTDAQEETEESVEKLEGKFDKMLQYLGQWEEMIKSNNEKIEDLKAEFEKRNPTQVEKLSMQTANSYPFNVTPEQYWAEKEKTSNYRTEDDDNGKEQGQYVITKNDVDGTTDWKGIADSLDDDAIYHPTLKNTMGNF